MQREESLYSYWCDSDNFGKTIGEFYCATCSTQLTKNNDASVKNGSSVEINPELTNEEGLAILYP